MFKPKEKAIARLKWQLKKLLPEQEREFFEWFLWEFSVPQLTTKKDLKILTEKAKEIRRGK